MIPSATSARSGRVAQRLLPLDCTTVDAGGLGKRSCSLASLLGLAVALLDPGLAVCEASGVDARERASRSAKAAEALIRRASVVSPAHDAFASRPAFRRFHPAVPSQPCPLAAERADWIHEIKIEERKAELARLLDGCGPALSFRRPWDAHG